MKKNVLFSNSYAVYEEYEVAVADEELGEGTFGFESYLDAWFEDERANLSSVDPDNENNIVAIVDLGRWNGRFVGFKDLRTSQISEVVSAPCECDEYEVYVEGNDIKATCRHHDGIHHITYRRMKEGRNIDALQGKLIRLSVNDKDEIAKLVRSYTMGLGKSVRQAYGW